MEYLEQSSFTPPGSFRTVCRDGRPYDGPSRLVVMIWNEKACYGNLLIPAGMAGITNPVIVAKIHLLLVAKIHLVIVVQVLTTDLLAC